MVVVAKHRFIHIWDDEAFFFILFYFKNRLFYLALLEQQRVGTGTFKNSPDSPS